MLDHSKRRRAMRPEVRVSRQALAVVHNLNGRIGDWQARVARLTALGLHLGARGAAVSDVLAEAQNLAAVVEAERLALQYQIGELPAAVAASSRILDTDRALQGILNGLEALATTLTPRTRTERTPSGAPGDEANALGATKQKP